MKKFKNAKEKQAYLQYQEWLESRTRGLKFSNKREPLQYTLPGSVRDTNPNKLTIRSHAVLMSSNATALKPSPKYTGTLIAGVATMHKSNAVPVLNKEQAVEVSQMRRN